MQIHNQDEKQENLVNISAPWFIAKKIRKTLFEELGTWKKKNNEWVTGIKVIMETYARRGEDKIRP